MANLQDHVNADAQTISVGNLLLFHGALLWICPSERHAERQVLDERPRPAWVFLPSLVVHPFNTAHDPGEEITNL